MTWISNRLRRLEEAARRLSDTITLEDGSELVLQPGERLDALLCATEGEPHLLHEPFSRLHPDSNPKDHELAALLRALGIEEA